VGPSKALRAISAPTTLTLRYKLMKVVIENSIRFMPTLILIAVAYLIYGVPSDAMNEGLKLSLSAFLGAIASFVFLQYSEFSKSISNQKKSNLTALQGLEIKLNEQLIWLSGVNFLLNGHTDLVGKVMEGKIPIAFDGSIYRSSINIENEITSLTNNKIINVLIELNSRYRKIENDLASMQNAYKFNLDLVISDKEYTSSYRGFLPTHIKNVQFLVGSVKSTESKTKNALALCRLLIKANKSYLNRFVWYLSLQSDPKEIESALKQEVELLNKEIEKNKKQSESEISGISENLNKTL